MNRKTIETHVAKVLAEQPVTDLHTHVYAPRFGAAPAAGGLMLWGVDELVTYHYLVAELYRVLPAADLPYDKFWALSKSEQADLIWRKLFVECTPLSEACRGVLTSLEMLGLDPNDKSLKGYRKFFRKLDPDRYVDKVMKLANVDCITMTNAVFDDGERGLWEKDASLGRDPRFASVLRIDPLLVDFDAACEKLRGWGYQANPDFSGETVAELRRFFTYWLDRMGAAYVASSLPPEFNYPNSFKPAGDRFIRQVLMPLLGERKLAWAMMIGSRRGVNAALRDAGDTGGAADVRAVANLCRDFPDNKFMVTMLARENQHELCVTARKFGNLMVFGCWWFLNNPMLIEEITRMRVELLGSSFVPQHSDARVLDQLLYKWRHSRQVLGKVLTDKYVDLARTGFEVTGKQIRRDAALLLRENYREFVKR
jgi:hypothetical protein